MHDNNEQDDFSGEEDFAALLEQSLVQSARIEPGQKVEARVLQVGDEWIFLDVGQKGEGVLEAKELLDADGHLTVAVGDTIAAFFISSQGGELRFTTRIGGGGSAGTAQLEEAWRSGIPVDGRIEKEVKGGYEVRLPGNVRAFCPFSQVGLHRNDTPDAIIGQNLSFKITQFAENGRNIVVSHRDIVEEERRQLREQLRETLHEGDRVSGTVTSIRDFGAFVDIGGVEGLLPISEIAYGRIEDINLELTVGQVLELVVKSIDWEKNRFSFSRRATLADPWSQVITRYKTGDTLNGTVSRLTPFGAFVTLEEGIDGLLHISKIAGDKHVKHPKDVLSVGQPLTVTIEKIEPEQKRISLNLGGEEEAPGDSSYTDAPTGGGMGSFADLLKAAQQKKERKRK